MRIQEIVGSDGTVTPVLFEGEEERLLPVYSGTVVYCGIMKAVGKMIALAIV